MVSNLGDVIMNIKQYAKLNFPGAFELYKHYRRKKVIKCSEKRKKHDKEDYKTILNQMYSMRIGHPINWDNPSSYTEKMQWDKLYNDDPQKTLLADKYAVREWVAETIGDEYLIPLLGVWNSFEEIDFDELPERFVLKTNHGSGTNLIVKNKATINYRHAKLAFDDWLNTDFGYKTMELHYSRIPRKIIAEKYIETSSGELQDYKFLCFNGEAYYCWVDKGRYSEHTRDIYDMSWNLQPWIQGGVPNSKEGTIKPENFDLMVELTRKLSNGFPHVRVDLYNVNGRIYFGEMTFSNGGGLDKITPEEYDDALGQLWQIPE